MLPRSCAREIVTHANAHVHTSPRVEYMNQNTICSIYEETFAKHIDIQNIYLFYFTWANELKKYILAKYLQNNTYSRRCRANTHFRATRRNGNAVVVIITRFNQILHNCHPRLNSRWKVDNIENPTHYLCLFRLFEHTTTW